MQYLTTVLLSSFRYSHSVSVILVVATLSPPGSIKGEDGFSKMAVKVSVPSTVLSSVVVMVRLVRLLPKNSTVNVPPLKSPGPKRRE